MKKFIFLVVLFSTISAHAKWVVTRMEGASAPAGTVSWSVLQRKVETHYGDFDIGIITNSVVEKSKEKNKSADAMASDLQKALKTGEWQKSRYGDLHFYTYNWPQQNRYFRLVIKEDKKHWLISFANLRQPYVLSSYYETDLLQRAFFIIESKRHVTASNWPWLFRSLVPEVHALDIAELSPTQIANIVHGYQSWLGNVTSTLGVNSAASLDNALNGLEGTVTTDINNVLRGAQNMVGQVSGGMNNLGGSIRQAAGSLDNFSSNLSRVVSFRNGLAFGSGLGLGLGAGGVIGAAAANFVLDGSSELVKKLFYAVTGQMDPDKRKEIRDRAEKYFKDLDESSKKIQQLETQLALNGLAMTYINSHPQADLLDESGADIRDANRQIKMIDDFLERHPDSPMARVCDRAASQLSDRIKFLSEMRAIFSTYSSDSKVSKAEICEQYANLMDKWRSAEADLQQAKIGVTVEMNTLLGALRDKQADSNADPASARERNNLCHKSVRDLVSSQKDRYKAKGCQDTPTTHDCQALSSQMELTGNGEADCDKNATLIQASNNAAVYAKNAQLSNEQIAIAEKSFNSVLKANCRVGEISEVCTGKAGDLTALEAHYEVRRQELKKNCPEVDTSNAAPLAEKSMAQGIPTPNQDLSKATDPAATSEYKASVNAAMEKAPVEPTSPPPQNIISRIWQHIMHLFGGG